MLLRGHLLCLCPDCIIYRSLSAPIHEVFRYYSHVRLENTLPERSYHTIFFFFKITSSTTITAVLTKMTVRYPYFVLISGM